MVRALRRLGLGAPGLTGPDFAPVLAAEPVRAAATTPVAGSPFTPAPAFDALAFASALASARGPGFGGIGVALGCAAALVSARLSDLVRVGTAGMPSEPA